MKDVTSGFLWSLPSSLRRTWRSLRTTDPYVVSIESVDSLELELDATCKGYRSTDSQVSAEGFVTIRVEIK